MWQEVKNSSGGTAQTASGTASSSTTEINCGFQPKYICISTTNFMTIYDADFSQTMAYRADNLNSSEPYTIAGNTGKGITEITSTGFKFQTGANTTYWFAATD